MKESEEYRRLTQKDLEQSVRFTIELLRSDGARQAVPPAERPRITKDMLETSYGKVTGKLIRPFFMRSLITVMAMENAAGTDLDIEWYWGLGSPFGAELATDGQVDTKKAK